MFLLVLLCSDVLVEYKNTGLFSAPMRREVAVADDGRLWLINLPDKTVLSYGPNGEKRPPLGRHGEGPGEFKVPLGVYFENGKIYLRDRRAGKIIVYDSDGHYLSEIREPGDGYAMFKIKGGWAYANWRISPDPNDPVWLRISHDAFASPKEVFTWPRDGIQGFSSITIGSNQQTKAPFNPALSLVEMAMSADGKRAFIYRPGEMFQIYVVNTDTAKVETVLKPKHKAIPFNQEWGNEQLAQQQEAINRQGLGHAVKFVAAFPEHFPHVRQLYVSVEGPVVAQLWTGQPNKQKRFLVMDARGQPANLSYNAKHEPRLLAMHQQQAWLVAAEEDELVILKIAQTEIDAVASRFPEPAEEPY